MLVLAVLSIPQSALRIPHFFNLVVALAISFAKMILIAPFFMHVQRESRLLHLAAFTGLLWFSIMLALTRGEYLSRGGVAMPNY